MEAQFVINLSSLNWEADTTQKKCFDMLIYWMKISAHKFGMWRLGLSIRLVRLGLKSKWTWIIFELNCEKFADQMASE